MLVEAFSMVFLSPSIQSCHLGSQDLDPLLLLFLHAYFLLQIFNISAGFEVIICSALFKVRGIKHGYFSYIFERFIDIRGKGGVLIRKGVEFSILLRVMRFSCPYILWICWIGFVILFICVFMISISFRFDQIIFVLDTNSAVKV